jgi:hypothetical protein
LFAGGCKSVVGPAAFTITNKSGRVVYRLAFLESLIVDDANLVVAPVGTPVCGQRQHADPARRQAVAVPADETFSYVWNGIWYGREGNGNDGCWQPKHASAGPHTARLCAGDDVYQDIWGSQPAEPLRCVAMPFELGTSPVHVRGDLK